MNKEIIIKHLNKSLTGELTSIRQYFLHSTILKDSGINKLAEKMKNELDEELEHANKLAERILLLKGIPNFQDTNEISKYDGKFTKDTIRKILEDNLKLEEEGLKDYREAISVAEKEGDFVSVILLEELLKNEEEHYHWIEEQIALIELIGVENYLKTQMLSWKNNIIKNMNLPVVCLLPNNDLAKFNYRHIKVDGILSDIELYVFAGQRGYHVLSPMLLTNGHYMLVNKGIVREKKKEEAKIEKIAASGVLYCDSNKSKSWLIKNDTALNTWFTLSTEEISNELGIKLEQCMLWQKGFSNKLTIQPMKHLEYAITWFALSLIWCVVYYRQNKRHSSG